MKQIPIAATVLVIGFAGAAMAGAPTEDPIKGGQTVNATRAASTPPGEDPIKGGQTFMAATGNDLGSPNPSRPNYSISPDWQAYTYDRSALHLVQINGPDGVVHVVIGVTNEHPLVLPLGVDADQVVYGVSQGGVVVYRDASIQIETMGGQWFVHPVSN